MLISILIGAIVAFLSSLFDGIINILEGYGNNVAGGTAAAGMFLAARK